MRLLPAAEAGHRSGLTFRQAWARASREYPELAHGRDAVNLYIGCVHTTGETERFLKVLAEQNDGTRGLQEADTLNDILQVHRHAPPVQHISLEVANAQSLRAKGGYLPHICGVYRKVFSHGKRFLKARKPRRDKGVKRDVATLEAQRLARGAPETEAAFLRKRDRQVEEAVSLAPEERVQKLRRTALGAVPVPPDTDLFVGDSIQAAREKAAERGRRKEETIERTRTAGRDTGGEASSAAKAGLTAKAGLNAKGHWAKELASDVKEDMSAKRDIKKGQLVLLEATTVKWPPLLTPATGWTVCSIWPTWLKHAFQRSPKLGGPEGYRHRSIVLRDVYAEALDTNATALCGRLVGGFLTTEAQVIRSQRSRSQGAQGVWYTGVAQGALMFLWLSPKLCENDALKAPLDCLRALCQHQTGLAIRLVDDLDKLKRAYQSHKSEKGTRSRPWTRYAALGNDEAECQELGSTDCPRLVRTFLSWLAERSAVAKKTSLVCW